MAVSRMQTQARRNFRKSTSAKLNLKQYNGVHEVSNKHRARMRPTGRAVFLQEVSVTLKVCLVNLEGWSGYRLSESRRQNRIQTVVLLGYHQVD